MSFYEIFEFFSVIVVTVQLIFGCFPFIYQQLIAPKFFGNSIDFKKYGKWAGIRI
jgi:hypothetical protein